jgi:flagellin
MSIYLQTNNAALGAEENFATTQSSLQSSFTKLSSGYRINSAADDAAGLGISKSMNAQVQSYMVAQRNANDAISMVQTADGSANQVHGLLTRMRELAVEASNGTMSPNDITNLNTEYQQDLAEIDRVANNTQFNGHTLLGGASNTVNFQVGINASASDQIAVVFGGADTSGLLVSGTAVSTVGVLATIDTAIQNLSGIRATYGAAMNRFQTAVGAIQSTQTNLSAALSRIQDVDVAAETANLAREQVLAQAGASVLAQANQAPQLALKLLQ